jgi:integrase
MATPKKTAQGTWRVQIEISGQRDSGTFATKREADEWNARRTLELRAHEKGGPGAGKTLRDALRRYAEEVSPEKRGGAKEMIRLAAFEKTAHADLPVKKRIQAVTSEDVAKWRDARLKTTARGSVLRDMGLLSTVLEQARREWKWIKVNPVADVRKPANPDHRERLITGPEIRKMLRKLGHAHPVRTVSQAVAMAFLAALATGMRAGELCGLTWENVRGDHVVLPMTKNGKMRRVPLSSTARKLIERMRGWDDQTVFGLGEQSMSTLFRKARARAGLDGFTFHDSRHTAATRMARMVDVLDLCKIMGWTNPRFALVYYNPKASDLARRLG